MRETIFPAAAILWTNFCRWLHRLVPAAAGTDGEEVSHCRVVRAVRAISWLLITTGQAAPAGARGQEIHGPGALTDKIRTAFIRETAAAAVLPGVEIPAARLRVQEIREAAAGRISREPAAVQGQRLPEQAEEPEAVQRTLGPEEAPGRINREQAEAPTTRVLRCRIRTRLISGR